MRMIDLSSAQNATEICHIIQGYMLFPDEEDKRIQNIQAMLTLCKFNQLREAEQEDGNITISCSLFDEAKHAVVYLFENQAEIKRRTEIGQRAGQIAAMFVPISHYHKSAGGKKQPSLTEVYDCMIGWAVECEETTGQKLYHNRTSLNEAWQKYGCVAHFWLAETLMHKMICRGMVDGEKGELPTSKRLNAYLAVANSSLELHKSIIPHGRTEPIINVEQAYWLPSEQSSAVQELELFDEKMQEPVIKSMGAFLKRHKGSKTKGKRHLRKKVEPEQR